MTCTTVGTMALDKAQLEKELEELLTQLWGTLEKKWGVKPDKLERLRKTWPRWQVVLGKRKMGGKERWQIVFSVLENVGEPREDPGQFTLNDAMARMYPEEFPDWEFPKAQRKVNRVLLSISRKDREEVERLYKQARAVKLLNKLLQVL